jgi:hypothetical protein
VPRQAGSRLSSQTLGISKDGRPALGASSYTARRGRAECLFSPCHILKAWLRSGLRYLRSVLIGLRRPLAFVGRSLPAVRVAKQSLLAKFLVATVCLCKRSSPFTLGCCLTLPSRGTSKG